MPTYNEGPGWRHFWLRRLHSLLGLMFGGYVCVHLLVNATGWSPLTYQRNVDKIHDMEPMLPVIEIIAIFLPLLFHAVYGAYIAQFDKKFNTVQYRYGGNLRYFIQRISAWILLTFVVYHIATLHKWGLGMFGIEGYPLFEPINRAYQTTAGAIKFAYTGDSPWAPLNLLANGFYLLGVWSAVFHFANGLWTSAIAWGLTITEASQRRWGKVCCGFGIAFLVVGTAAWAAFGVAGKPDYPLSKTTTITNTEEALRVHQGATGVPGSPELPSEHKVPAVPATNGHQARVPL